MEYVTCPHEDAFVITAEIDKYKLKRVLIDVGKLTDILFLETLKKMGKSEKDLKKINFPLMGFASNATFPIWAITLPVHIGVGWKTLTVNVTFIAVDAPASYNTILGCSMLNLHRMVHYTYLFLIPHGIWVVKGD